MKLVSFKDAIYEVERSILCADVCKKIIKKNRKKLSMNFWLKKNEAKIEIIEEPLKLFFAITPFNLPLLSLHKIFPAIIANVPIVLKPSENFIFIKNIKNTYRMWS